jgi:hypothetical protein
MIMKKISISLLVSIGIIFLTVVFGSIINSLTQPKPEPLSLDFPVVPWWSKGLPLSLFSYSDCSSGCIGFFNLFNVTFDIVFWFSITYYLFDKLIKKRKSS